MRGEYFGRWRFALRLVELPPRARRIPSIASVADDALGTTSACAENTCGCRTCVWASGNYLRVRGEYAALNAVTGGRLELPPRARRIRSSTPARYSCSGTTSACAENTATAANLGLTGRNYLRVRGEYHPSLSPAARSRELPPRARRIP